MSLVIKKFQEGGSPEVRRYKRGNDEVDLDAFVRQAEVGFNDWLNNADIKEKHKKEVRAAYQDMITRINNDPESFAARLGGGFTNTAGITNKTKGFDAYGVAAGYLGNTLRNMSVYTKPTTKSDKPKYNRHSALITSNMQSYIYGDTPGNFVMLDPYNETTGKRGITNRTAQSITGLQALRDTIDDYYDFDSESDRQHAIDRINSVIEKLQNSDPNDDWFSLGQLGVTGVDKLFFTGKATHPTSPQTPEEQAADASRRRSQQFEQWVSNTYPRYSGTLHDKVPLFNNSDLPVSNAALTEFRNKFNSFSNTDLKKWIQEYISNIDSYDINNNQFMRRIYPNGIPNFNTGQVITVILNRMRENGMLYKLSPDSTKYYIPGTSREGAGYVWDADPNVNALYHMDIHDIPYWQQRISNEFSENISAVSSYADPYWSQRYPGMYRRGGILKAQQGVKFDDVLGALTYLPEDLADDRRLRNIYTNGAFTQQPRTTPATDEIYPGNNQYDPEPGGSELEQQDYYKNWLNILTTNESVAEAWARRYKALQPTTSVHYSPWFNSDDTFNFEQFKNALVNNKKVYSDAINGIGHDFYRGRVYQMLDQDGNPLAGYYNQLQDGYELVEGDPTLDPGNLAWVYQMREKAPEDQGEETPNPKKVAPAVISDGGNPDDEARRAYLAEVIARMKDLGSNPSLARQGFWGELGTDLLGAGRLAGSIQANNRIARTVRESLRPKLHNTYELYSPVTGAFSEMQLRNRQGAETLSQSYRPFTSDASLAAARMLEGQRNANDLQYQGFLADDKEIKRTQAEALARQEGNIARRSALENENRDAIIANNQALAQLEASRIKQNWNSIDNYLQGVEGRVRNRITENKERYNQFALQTSNASADQFRREAINSLRDKYEKWKDADSSRANLTFTDWATQNSEPYALAMQDINAITEALKYRGYANVYGLGYDWPTWKDQNGNEVPISFDVNSGRYKWLKFGGPIRLNANRLIDKIIRNNNESSS